MTMELIFEYINRFGFMTMFAGTTVYLLYKYFNKKLFIKKAYNKLYNHEIFTTIDIWLKNRIKNLNIVCPLRAMIFKDFIYIKFESVKNNLTKLAMLPGLDKYNNTELQNVVMACIVQIITEYESKAESIGIPKMVVNKFNYWHAPKVELIKKSIISICHSGFISDNSEKLSVIFNNLELLLHMTLIDAESTLYALNGELDSVSYNASKCFKCKPECKKRKHD